MEGKVFGARPGEQEKEFSPQTTIYLRSFFGCWLRIWIPFRSFRFRIRKCSKMIKSKDFKLQFYFDFNLRIQKIRNCSIFNLKKVLILISFDFDFTFELQLLLFFLHRSLFFERLNQIFIKDSYVACLLALPTHHHLRGLQLPCSNLYSLTTTT